MYHSCADPLSKKYPERRLTRTRIVQTDVHAAQQIEGARRASTSSYYLLGAARHTRMAPDARADAYAIDWAALAGLDLLGPSAGAKTTDVRRGAGSEQRARMLGDPYGRGRDAIVPFAVLRPCRRHSS
jgi:hypothetical protein